MGIQTMGSQSNNQQSHIQPSQLMRQNSWYSLTLNEVGNQLGNLGKPLGSMNLDEVLQCLWSSDTTGMNTENSSASSLQRQASLNLAQALSGKTVDQVWEEIQKRQKKGFGKEQDPKFGDLTLEDFLVQAGLFAVASQNSSTGTLSDSSLLGRKSNATDSLEKSIERRLMRKIKNRESAARSRARKQAYHNELVNKVSRLEEQNIKLKLEKGFENIFPSEPLTELKYQLRRTSSAMF